MHILVVGGAGYIGSVTVDQLIDAGHEVTVLDNLVSGHREAINEAAELVNADVRDEDALGRLFASHNFQAVINYSGYILVAESVRQPGRYFANNIGGAIALLNAMATYDVKRFVFSSSAAVYGQPQSIPITEDQPLRPINPYGETKAAVERLLPWYEATFGIRSVSLRYFNAAGATDLRGEDHRPEAHLIANVLQIALGQRPALSLYGTDYPTRDGTCVRDYVHVADLAAAHLLALDSTATPPDRPEANVGAPLGDGGGAGGAAPLRPAQQPTIGSDASTVRPEVSKERTGQPNSANRAYNLSLGRGFTNREVIDAVRRVTGHAIPVSEEPRRPGDPPELVASNSKARADLGWRLHYTDLDEIIDTAWCWHRAHPAGYGS